MKITADEAREFFSHPSQQIGFTPNQIPDGEGFHYYAHGGVCGLFHLAPWPRVYMAHYGVKPEAWGKTKDPALKVLGEFWDDYDPEAIIGWTDKKNRAAISFARRLGFRVSGEINLPSGTVVMQEWQKWA